MGVRKIQASIILVIAIVKRLSAIATFLTVNLLSQFIVIIRVAFDFVNIITIAIDMSFIQVRAINFMINNSPTPIKALIVQELIKIKAQLSNFLQLYQEEVRLLIHYLIQTKHFFYLWVYHSFNFFLIFLRKV